MRAEVPVDCPAFRPELLKDRAVEGPGAVSRRQVAAFTVLAALPWFLVAVVLLG